MRKYFSYREEYQNMGNKLDKAFLKLDETEKKLLASDDFDIELMREFNENLKEVTQVLYDYNKPSLRGFFKFNGKKGI